MIHTLDTKAADYIPELGDGFGEGSEEAKTHRDYRQLITMLMQMAKAFITSHIKQRLPQKWKPALLCCRGKTVNAILERKAGEVIEGTLYLHFGEMIRVFSTASA